MKNIPLVLSLFTLFGVSVSTVSAHAQEACEVQVSAGTVPDTDCDGVADIFDNCDATPNGNCQADSKRCDVDGDGSLSDAELSGGNQADFDDDGVGDACSDSDDDGVGDVSDNCPDVKNADQADVDEDGFGDVCGDADGDDLMGNEDNCPLTSNADQADHDRDGRGDVCDSCAYASNPNQEDADGNGEGDACEGDTDSDRKTNDADNCVLIPNPDQRDSDEDGLGDMCDNCARVANADQSDGDDDDKGDACEGFGVNMVNPAANPNYLEQRLHPMGSGGCSSQMMPGSSSALLPLGLTLLGLGGLLGLRRFF